ncbi:SGNH/GDSL hydrolase family protein [Kitasatospora sp. NPDC096147]|uniref:SGNH/GDSL hydrolase family protein n=1 Tax=Kitasatospora sp. NPDC096147 TaxID=3364093 RepID=UPI00380C43BB
MSATDGRGSSGAAAGGGGPAGGRPDRAVGGGAAGGGAVGGGAGQAERLVRFQQPERALPYLGRPSRDVLAALFGLESADYAALLTRFEEQAREAARELTADPVFAARVAALPFRPGQRVLVLGESSTADRLSWCEILRHLLPPGVELANRAVSGCTTTEALGRAPWLTAAGEPDAVLCMLGANDLRRSGPGGTRLVSASETGRNLRELRNTLPRTPWYWITPSAVDEVRIAAHPPFRAAGIGWRAADVDELAAHLADGPEPVVDVRSATVGELAEDGLHLTPAGQRAVLVALVESLAPDPGRAGSGTAGTAGTARVQAEAAAEAERENSRLLGGARASDRVSAPALGGAEPEGRVSGGPQAAARAQAHRLAQALALSRTQALLQALLPTPLRPAVER